MNFSCIYTFVHAYISLKYSFCIIIDFRVVYLLLYAYFILAASVLHVERTNREAGGIMKKKKEQDREREIIIWGVWTPQWGERWEWCRRVCVGGVTYSQPEPHTAGVFTSASSSMTPCPPPNTAAAHCCLGDRTPFETRSVKWPSGLRRLSRNTRQTNRQTHRQTDLWSCVCFSAYAVVHNDLSVCLSAMHVLNLTALWIQPNPVCACV